MEESLLRSALEQSFTIGAFLVAIVILWRENRKLQSEKDALANGVLKITYMWEERYSKESQDDKDIKELLKENRDFMIQIKEFISKMKNGSR